MTGEGEPPRTLKRGERVKGVGSREEGGRCEGGKVGEWEFRWLIRQVCTIMAGGAHFSLLSGVEYTVFCSFSTSFFSPPKT